MPEQRQPQTVTAERRAKVDARRTEWIRQLVDLSRRNNLLYFRDLKVGTLDLTLAPAEVRHDLLSGDPAPSIALTDFMEAPMRDRAAASMQEIAERARSNFEERGLDTLFLAIGFASWPARDEGRGATAPVLLVPLEATQAGGRSGAWKLRRAGDISVNSVLAHALREEHGLVLDVEALASTLESDRDDGAPALKVCFDEVLARASVVPGFALDERWVVGNFAFQKMAIVRDLERLGEALAAHHLVAGISGDQEAAEIARGDRTESDASLADRTPPEQEFLIRDADSSQQRAIAHALAGRNGVISGPPGTGKSQTIANLIAECVARGKRVLFVAEKRAALDVVLNRLREADLDHLCLDCHGAELTRRRVAEQMKESFERVREAPLPNTADLHRTFVERRDRLNEHVRSLHSTRQPGGRSVYDVYVQLASVPDVPCSARVTASSLQGVDFTTMEACAQRARELASLAPLVTRDSPSPWVDGRISSLEQLQSVVSSVRELAGERWPAWEHALGTLLDECGLRPPDTVGRVASLLGVLKEVQETLSESDVSIFRLDLAPLQDMLRPAERPLRRLVSFVTDGRFRAALRAVRLHHRQKIGAADALQLVRRVLDQRSRWQEVSRDPAALPQGMTHLEAALSAWSKCDAGIKALERVFPGRGLDALSLDEAGGWVRLLSSDMTTPAELLRVHQLEQELVSCGFEPLLKEIRDRRPLPATWCDMVRRCWLLSCLEQVQLQDPNLPSFRGRLHDEIAEEFRLLDRERLNVAIQRVQRAHAAAAIEVRNQQPGQSALVGREANKKSRHIPLRKLLAEAPDVMLALRPCWMASPLSVSQIIPGERPLFDVVVFDEASQVLPEDAVTSLLRGKQAVIAGDSRQLPPTTFFAAGADGDGPPSDDGDENGTHGFQSILDVMSAFLEPAWSLDWHYRSRDEALIAFSNHHIYGGRLVTFPGPRGSGAVTHELVPHVVGDGPEASAGREVQRVVALILDHVARRSHESLGVITMGIEHAKRIEMALARARQEHPEVEQFFASDKREPFFVKNLERVQGDERDAIILSIGYGKNEAGHLLYRFGPLLQEGGERRLNVAITRARQRMSVVSSFSHADMQPDYPKLGVRLLRTFLEYAASGGVRLDGGTVTSVPLNPFEQSISDELTRRGLKILPQLGTSRYRIDLVAVHPKRPGRYVLAIECDGATYHSAPTARDRDRLRQQQLEALGWRFHRIWSTDWFQRREEEVQRTLIAFEAAVAHADTLDSGGHAAPARAVTPFVADSPSGQTAGPEVPRRPSRPAIKRGKAIDDYARADLVALARWLQSDGRLRTDEELVAELVRELGFQRKGARIAAALESAVQAAKAK